MPVRRHRLLRPPADDRACLGRPCCRSAPIAAATCSACIRSLAGLKQIFDSGKLAVIQRTGYQNSSRSHFQGFDIWGTANPADAHGPGWLGRYLDTLPSPIDPLVGWNTTRETPRALMARTVGVPAITNPATYSFASPNSGAEAGFERAAAVRISSHLPADRPHLAFVNSTAQAALGTLDRVATVATYRPSLTYPNNGFAQALQAVAGAMFRQIGTKVFWVATGGYDTHANQNPVQRRLSNADGHGQRRPDRVRHRPAATRGCSTRRWCSSSRSSAAASPRTAARAPTTAPPGIMMAMGGLVRGGLYGTAAKLRNDPANPDLENSAGDVRHETDFRSVYASVLDNWLGAELGRRSSAPTSEPGAPAIL